MHKLNKQLNCSLLIWISNTDSLLRTAVYLTMLCYNTCWAVDKSADCLGLRPHLWNGDNDNSAQPLMLHKLSSCEWSLTGKDSKVSPRSFFTRQDFILKFKRIHLPYLEEHLHPFQLFLNALFHLGALQCKCRKSPLEAQVLVCKVQEIQGVEGKTKKMKGGDCRRPHFRRWAHSRVHRYIRKVDIWNEYNVIMNQSPQ